MIPNRDELISNEKMPNYIASHITSIDEIEQLTGIQFLPELKQKKPQLERNVTKNVEVAIWEVDGSWPKVLTSNCKQDYADW